MRNAAKQTSPSRWGTTSSRHPPVSDDAETCFNQGDRFHSAGKLAEAIESYRRAISIKPEHFKAYAHLGMVLQKYGKPDEAVACYRKALLIKPDLAVAHYNLGLVLQRQDKPEQAIESYRKAIKCKPDYAAAYFSLGNAFLSQGMPEAAAENYRKAIAHQPALAEAHNNLGIALNSLNDLNGATASFRKAISFKPAFMDAYNNLGNALREQGKLDEAIVCYRKALSLRPEITGTHNNLGFTLLLTGQFREGWKEYWLGCSRERPRYPVLSRSDNPLLSRNPDELLPADLHGIRIALLKDQGLGDELYFMRFARELQKRGAWTGYVPDPRLASFIRRASWVNHVANPGEVIGDIHAALLVSDLPLVLGMSCKEDIPPPVPLEVLPEKRQEIAMRLAPHQGMQRPLIGITWRGGTDNNPLGSEHLFKEIPAGQLAEALRGIQATFVIVQRNPQPGKIAGFEAALGQPVLDFSDLNDDLEGMLALMEQLDDYVGVSNTNMHLRAGVGKTARVLVPHMQDFRWMGKGDCSPWFPGFTIYRRASEGSWDAALGQLKSHLLRHYPQH